MILIGNYSDSPDSRRPAIPETGSNGHRSDRSRRAPDGRQELRLTSAEADYVRAGMREHVVNLQALLAGLANNDLDGAARAEHSAGTRTRTLDGDPTRPPTLGPKLPAVWKSLLQARMRGFDQVSQDIASKAETVRIASDISTAMATCVACHETFKLVVVDH